MATGPLVLGVVDLRRQPGTRRRIERAVELAGLGISTAVVPEGSPVEADLELEAVSNGIVATGMVRAPWVGECRRCLRPVEGISEAKVQEIFEQDPTEGETYPLGNEVVDLEPMVRDAVLLALPLAPLCGEDCKGPAPEEFPTGPAGALDDDSEPAADPRWAALAELDFDPEDLEG